MTSTNDGKDVKSNQTSGPKGKTYYIELYKSLEARLSAVCTGEQRTQLVSEAWRRVHSLCQHSAPATHPHLVAWLQRHTSHSILQTEWQLPKSKEQHGWLEEALDTFITECRDAISKRDAASSSWESQLLHTAIRFKNVLPNPWGHPVLKALLDSEGTQPTDEEVAGWLKEEGSVMFVSRLRQLAASKCDDLALLLAAAVNGRVRASSATPDDKDQTDDHKEPEASKNESTFVKILHNEAGFTMDVLELLTDIEFVLLYKRERSRCIELAKQTPLRIGCKLVDRLRVRLEKSPRDKKLWKNAKDVATLIAQVVIARCMVVPTCGGAVRVALTRCAGALVLLLPPDKLPPATAALAAPAATARHLHTLADAVHAQCKEDRKSFICELYVRAINTGMNELERLKLKTEKEAEARLAEENLSNWFIQLGALLSKSSRMSCECLLTAFSIHPSSAMYDMVKAAPLLAPLLKDFQEPGPATNSEFGSWATDSRTQTNLVKTSETLNIKTTQKQANILSTAIFAEGEALGLGTELCQDLAVLISGPRVKTLSWDMDRETLLENCRTYIDRTHGGTRALTTELKYLNLDPSSFQHLPEETDDENDAFYGIEKGYEHLVEFQEPEEIWQDALSNDSFLTDTASEVEIPIAIPKRKKKSKRLTCKSDEETDPLSLTAEIKKAEKKERPQSKERKEKSKDRKEHSKERKDKKEKPIIKKDINNESANSTENDKADIEKSKELLKKEKKKERKERKKKEKAERKRQENALKPVQSGGCLSRLVGMKVARLTDTNLHVKQNNSDPILNNVCITDSDYDSQGKSSITSLNSEGNDSEVLFDGLFSMDEIKSPEKSITDSFHRTNIHKVDELRISNGTILNNAFSVPQLNNEEIYQSQGNLQSGMQCNRSESVSAIVTAAKDDVREEVKNSIKKLIEFRRNKSFIEEQKHVSTFKTPGFIQDKELLPPTSDNFYGSQSILNTSVSYAPKVFLNQEKVKHLNALKNEVDNILKHCGNKTKMDQITEIKDPFKKNVISSLPIDNTCDKTTASVVICRKTASNYSQPINKVSVTDIDHCKQQLQKSNLMNTESQNQKQYKEFLKQRNLSVIKAHPLESSSQKSFQNLIREKPKKVLKSKADKSRSQIRNVTVKTNECKPDAFAQSSDLIHVNPIKSIKMPTQSKESPKQCSAKTVQQISQKIKTDDSINYNASQFQSFLKELQETINAGATKDTTDEILPTNNDKVNCTQPIIQKKVDNAPKTFSRLSYLHKNKQNDSRHTVSTDQVKPLQNISAGETQNLGIPLDKVSDLQSKGEIIISRIDKTKNNSNNKVIIQRLQNLNCSASSTASSSCLNKQYPIISNILSTENQKYSLNTPCKTDGKIFEQKNFVSPISSSSGYLSEKDQIEVSMLLRQQSKMHPLKHHQKTEIPKKSEDSIIIPKTNVQLSDTHHKDSNTISKSKPILEKSMSQTDLISPLKAPNNKVSNPVADLKKVRTNKAAGKSSNSKQTVKNDDNQKSDWESVMNALRAHKTPSRGPNALDIALKKDSFEKRSLNNTQTQDATAKNIANNSSKVEHTNSKRSLRSIQSTLPTVCSASKVTSTANNFPDLKQKQLKKLSYNDGHIEMARRSPLDFNDKHLTDIIQNDDPFISGIPNSDYDLLEELMDDDLRKEIRELMSDEEAYGVLTPNPKTRSILHAKDTNSFVNKFQNYKINPASIRNPPLIDSCQDPNIPKHLNTAQNINPTPTKSIQDLAPKCISINKLVNQTKLPSNSPNTPNLNLKPKIISNELITPRTLQQSANLKKSSSVQAINAVVKTETNNCDQANLCVQETKNYTTCETNNLNTNNAVTPKVVDVPKPIRQSNILDPNRVVLTVPKKSVTPNVMLIGSDVFYDPISTIQVEQSSINENMTNFNKSAYVAVNPTPNSNLYSTAQLVSPCVNPVIIEQSITLPVIQRALPNITMNRMSSNLSTALHNPEPTATPIEKPQNKKKILMTPTAKLNLIANTWESENQIKTSTAISNLCEIDKSSTCSDFVKTFRTKDHNIPTAVKEISKLLPDSVKCKTDGGNEMQEFSQPLQLNENLYTNQKSILIKNNSEPNAVVVGRTQVQEKDPKTPAVNKPNNDKNVLENERKKEDNIKRNQKRIQRKRMLILNRQISFRSLIETIALPYQPIKTKDVSKLEKGKRKANQTREKSKKKSRPYADKIPLQSETYKDKKTADDKKITSIINEKQNSILDSSQKLPDNTLINDKNSSESTCRRILLRSSNIIKETTIPSFVSNIEEKKTSCQSSVKKKKNVKNKSIEYSKSFKFSSSIKPIIHKIDQDTSTEFTMDTKINKTKEKQDEKIVEETDYTSVDIEEQIISSIIPNILKETQVFNKTSNENVQESCSAAPTSSVENNPSIWSLCDTENVEGSDTRVKGVCDNTKKSNKNEKANKKEVSNCNKSNKSYLTTKSLCFVNNTDDENIKILSSNNEEKPHDIDKTKNSDTISNNLFSIVHNTISVDEYTHNPQEIVNKDSSKTVPNDILEYKNNVVFEELPNYNNDPLKKCIRIKLPNGNTFKATISGKLNVNVDSIFEDPTIKTLLWKNINNNLKCTLNIKQVAIKTATTSPSVRTEVQGISYPQSISKTETINLISDDEEEPQTFETEFGKCNIGLINRDIFTRHQKRLSQKCVVQIEKCNIFTKTTTAPDTPKSASHGVTDSSTSTLTTLEAQNIEDTIEIDDSSNDTEVISELPDLEVGINQQVIENVDVSKKLLLEDLCVNKHTPYIAIDSKNDCNEVIENFDTSFNENNIKTTAHFEGINSKECFLKIEKCDELVKKLKIQKNPCFVNLVRCDDNLKGFKNNTDFNSNKPPCYPDLDGEIDVSDEFNTENFKFKRCGSLSILSEFDKTHESNSELSIDQIKNSKCSSATLGSYDIITEIQNDTLISNEFVNKPITSHALNYKDSNLRRTESLSVLSEFSISNVKKSMQKSLSAIDNVEIPAPAKDSLIISGTFLKHQSEKVYGCGAEWLVTKSNLHGCYSHNLTKVMEINTKIDNRNLKFDEVSTDCDSDNESNSPINSPEVNDNEISGNIQQNLNQVPSLGKLIVNYFVNNINVLENLKHVMYKNVGSKILSSSPLKRKSMNTIDKINRHKISKLGYGTVLNDSGGNEVKASLEEKKGALSVLLDGKKEFMEASLRELRLQMSENENINCEHMKECRIVSADKKGTIKTYDINITVDEKEISSREKVCVLNNIADTTREEITVPNEINKKELDLSDKERNLNGNCEKNSTCVVYDTQPRLSNSSTTTTAFEINVNSNLKEHIIKTLESNIIEPESRTDPFNINNDFVDECKNREMISEDKIEVIIPLVKMEDKKYHSEILTPMDSKNVYSSEKLMFDGSSGKSTLNDVNEDNHKDVAPELNINMNKEENINAVESININEHSSDKLILYENILERKTKLEDDEILYQKSIHKDNLQNFITDKYECVESQNDNIDDSANEAQKLIDEDIKASDDRTDRTTTTFNNNSAKKNITLVYKGDSDIVLKGSIYEDPIVGTCYVFPILNRASIVDEINYNAICEDTIDVKQSLKPRDIICGFDQKENDFNLLLPKVTYSRQRLKEISRLQTTERITRKNLKRKNDHCDSKLNEKRYRKGKNIDYPKITVTAMSESAYSKEYKRLLNYCSSIKFSFSHPFHKECVDIYDLLKCWPIKENNIKVSDQGDNKCVLFSDETTEERRPYDPLQQTLAEEIASTYVEEKSSLNDVINESNFSMGFGDGSDRVTQHSEENISKFSAATLSDVKQSQPFLLYEDNDFEKDSYLHKTSEESEVFKHYISYIRIRENVRAFFKKNTLELHYQWHKDNMESKCKSANSYNDNTFPYDLTNLDFFEPAPIETTVQVVQVGQLPVSAAAQNPVTCDPRVTQVTDASPSQCSIENSPHDDSQSPIKTEYTELTTADLTLPLVQEYERHIKSQESSTVPICGENIPVAMEVVEITTEETTIKLEPIDYNENEDLQSSDDKHINNVDYPYDSHDNNSSIESTQNTDIMCQSLVKDNSELITLQEQQNHSTETTDQISHAMNAAGITTSSDVISNQKLNLVDITSQKNGSEHLNHSPQTNNISKSPINEISLQQALVQMLPPPLNQTNSQENNLTTTNNSASTPVLHIVQGKNTNGNQVTLIDQSHNTVINNSNTQMLHVVHNKSSNNNATPNENTGHTTYSGISLVDAGLQQGNNQLLHIVNTGNQKNTSSGQLLKRVNLLTNVTNAQGSNEHKMVQFLCKSTDGKSFHLNAPHQRGMVLRLQPIESTNIQGSETTECQDLRTSSNPNIASIKESNSAQHEIKSRSVYEENYAKFIQSSSNKSIPEKGTSLPKFNQAFGKQVFQEPIQKTDELDSSNSHLSSVDLNTENSECQSTENTLNLDQIGPIGSPPLLTRKPSGQTTPSSPSTPPNLVQHIKQTITPMNIQTMHGGVIYTRQIPVNIGGGQTINLITVPSTELMDEAANHKQHNHVKFIHQNDVDSPIIKIVPQSQTHCTDRTSDENISHTSPNDGSQNSSSHPQPVLTQMRIKLPMLSKAPQMISGTRVVRPSFFQIQRNVIGGTNQPVYQQLVLTTAPPLGQHTIRLPQGQITKQVKETDNQSSSETPMSSSTLEQLREFDMVLEQVKERSTVQPTPNSNSTFTKLNTPASDTTDSTSITSTVTESTQQVFYSIGSNQSLNVAYVSRKVPNITPSQTVFVRAPDSSGIVDSPSSSTHVQIPHTVTSQSISTEGSVQSTPPKVTKVRSRSRPKSHPSNSLKLNSAAPKTSTQKPLEDEQTTQRILYILAEYKEQVENSPDKDKPAPRRRTNPPSNPGSSKRKKSSSSSRRPGTRDISPVHGDDTCRTMGSEDSSCGTSQGDCNENCLDSNSPEHSPRKVVRKLTFENEIPQPRPQPHRNVIVADGQTITVARGTAGKPTTAVLMPANYLLPVSMVKNGQQIAIVTNRGPKLITVGGESVATNALLLQRLIGPAGLKPVFTRPGVRHVRLPTAALHNLHAFNLAAATTVQPPDSTASSSAPTPPEVAEARASGSPWTDRESHDVKPDGGSSPDGSEPPWLTSDPLDYSYEETVRTENMDRTVLDAIQDRYSPEMEPIDKMFDVESKKSFNVDSQDDSSRYPYDIEASDSDDKPYPHQVVRKDGSHRQHRLTHVSAAALRHKYAILEHELRLQGTAFLQKSLSEECEDLGVDSPSAAELFPEADLLFSNSPAHDAQQHSHTPQPTIINQGSIPQPDIDDQIATDHLLDQDIDDQQDLGVTLGLDEGIVTVSEDGMQATINLDQEEFARSHPNTTFHKDEEEMQPYTITGLKGPHITSTIFHAGRAPATVLVAAPQTTVISQATPDGMQNNVKFTNINQIINASPATHGNINIPSVLVRDDRLTRYDNILTDSRELHLSNTASAIIHSTGNATQVIRRVCYEDDRRDARFLLDEPEGVIAGNDAKMVAEDNSREATLESMAGDYENLPERNTELFWESNSTSERLDGRRPLDFSSDSERCCKSPSYDETNSTDSCGVGTHMRLDSVIKDTRGLDRGGSADRSSADDTHPPLRTYPAKRMYHNDVEMERSTSGKTRAGYQDERSDMHDAPRRASGRGVVKRGCPCCIGSPGPARPKKPRHRKPTMDFNSN